MDFGVYRFRGYRYGNARQGFLIHPRVCTLLADTLPQFLYRNRNVQAVPSLTKVLRRQDGDYYMTFFDKSMTRLLPIEGGYSDDQNDPGNWTGGHVGAGRLLGTKYGIAANTYPNEDIKNLTWERAKELYKRDYWDRVRGDDLPGAVAYSGLDGAINSGVLKSVMWLQQAAGVADDGKWGPITAAAVAAADPNDLVLRYNGFRLRFMTNLNAWDRYGKGWARRIAQNLLYGAEDN